MPDVSTAVALIVPTVHHRARLFSRTLRYFSGVGWHGPIVVSDHSPEPQLDIIRGIVERHRDLNISLLTDSPETHFLTRLARCAKSAGTDYVHLHADDDFVVFPTLTRLHALMESERGLSACMGLNMHFEFETRRFAPITKTSVRNPDPFGRLLSQLENYSSVLYALRRRTEFIENVSYAESRCPDVQFWQYLETCEAALSGALLVTEDLHYVRQLHAEKWSNQLAKQRSPEHFPSLILAPQFHARTSAFREALTASCVRRGIAVDAATLDDGIIHLLYRGFSAMGLPERHSAADPVVSDEATSRRLQDANDPAVRELNRICEVAASAENFR